MIVRFKRLRPSAVLPRYMTEGAAGMDLSYAADEELILEPGARLGVPTGWAIEVPPGYEAQVRPRSGLAFKSGVTVVNAPGTVDSDYRGELVVLLINLDAHAHVIRPGDRVAQMVVAPVVHAQIEQVDALSHTARGGDGFGSTGSR